MHEYSTSPIWDWRGDVAHQPKQSGGCPPDALRWTNNDSRLGLFISVGWLLVLRTDTLGMGNDPQLRWTSPEGVLITFEWGVSDWATTCPSSDPVPLVIQTSLSLVTPRSHGDDQNLSPCIRGIRVTELLLSHRKWDWCIATKVVLSLPSFKKVEWKLAVVKIVYTSIAGTIWQPKANFRLPILIPQIAQENWPTYHKLLASVPILTNGHGQ